MRRTVISFFLSVLISLPAAVFAEQALVPKSGQTLCYDAAGVEISCAGTGQDGDQQMGIPWPNPRFTDNGNGTVTDNLTGLIWLKNANCYNYGWPVNWSSALSAANTLVSGACGLTDGSVAGDWRLPNRAELGSLINRKQAISADWLNTMGFINVSNDSYRLGCGYWTSSSNGGSAWQVFLTDGHVQYLNVNYQGWVWPVRGGK